MYPNYVADYAGKRIESFVSIGNVMVDITWLPTTLPHIGRSFYDVPQDSLEIHIANLYKDGKLLIGNLPNEGTINQDFLPYYQEELRQTRLRILRDLILRKIENFKQKILKKDPDIFSSMGSLRKLFLQWLFIKKKQYPNSYEKYLSKQLEMLDLPFNMQNDILCLDGYDIFNIAGNFLDTIKILIEEEG